MAGGAPMDLGILFARLEIDSSSLDKTAAKAKGLGDSLLLGLGAAVIGVAGFSVDMASKFDSSLSLIQANANITAGQAKAIGDAFMSTAGQSTFSANTIAAAFAPVAGQLAAVNGGALDANQSLGFMNAAMALAEATGAPLADTTAGLAQVMQAYGINVAGAAGASDLLYNASRMLNVPVGDLVGVVDKLHAKLGPLAPSLSDVTTLLGDVASHGLTGSRALMLVSTGLGTLLSGSKPVTKELESLGLKADALWGPNGTFIGIPAAIALIQPKLAGMTEQQRLLAEKTLFGNGASKALDATIMAGLPGWDKSAAKIQATGTAQQGAKTATDNLKGSFEKLKGRVDDLLTQFGQHLTPALKNLADWATAHADILLPVFGAVGVLGAMAVIYKGVKDLVGKIGTLFTDLVKLVKNMGLAAVWIAEHVKMLAASISFHAQYFALWVAEKAKIFATWAEMTSTWIAANVAMMASTVKNAAIIAATWVAEKLGFTAGVAEGVAAFEAGDVAMAASAATTAVAVEGSFLAMLGPIGLVVAAIGTATLGLIALSKTPLPTATSPVQPGSSAAIQRSRGGPQSFGAARFGNMAANGPASGPGPVPYQSYGPPSAPSPTHGHLAAGGPAFAGGRYLVGERGPELFVPTRSGTIIPNDKLMNGGPVTVTQHFNINGGNPAEVQAIVRRENATMVAALRAGRR